MRIVRYQEPRVAPRFALATPWAGLEQDIDRMMHAAFSDFFAGTGGESALTHPNVDLFEDKDHFYFRADLPGLEREDIQVEMGDGVLTLSGTRKSVAADGQAGRTSQFTRTVAVPARVQEDNIAARYEDGVLTVTLPKAEEIKPKKIAVQVK